MPFAGEYLFRPILYLTINSECRDQVSIRNIVGMLWKKYSLYVYEKVSGGSRASYSKGIVQAGSNSNFIEMLYISMDSCKFELVRTVSPIKSGTILLQW